MSQDLYTLAQAARFAAVTRQAIEYQIRIGNIKVKRMPHGIFIPHSQLAQYKRYKKGSRWAKRVSG